MSGTFNLGLHVSTVLTARSQDTLSRDVFYDQQFDRLLRDFDPFRSALPLVKNHFDLAAQEFRNVLALQYEKSLSQLPKSCDGCGVESIVLNIL